MKRVLILVILSFFIVACAKSIEDVRSDEYLEKEVKLKGTVENTVKIGQLSGYTLVDKTGQIAVASDNLPKEGSKVNIKGKLLKSPIFGYYVEVD